MTHPFRSIEELQPGEKWRSRFDALWPLYERWYVREGDEARPSYRECTRALREHMPEIVPVYQALCDLAGGGDRAARFLSMYNPPAYLSGCSQAAWTRGEPALVRNYDYAPHLCEKCNMLTAWRDGRVISMIDCLWGALDGMNEAGLAVALAFGGRKVTGKGFGIPVIVRYVLETCETVDEAVTALQRIPSHMTYNVTLLDQRGRYATVFTGPDQPAEVRRAAVATNHQREIEWPEHARLTETLRREAHLTECLLDPEETRDRFIARFLKPPLYRTGEFRKWRTLYTAIYEPRRGGATYLWPQDQWTQSFDRFTERGAPAPAASRSA